MKQDNRPRTHFVPEYFLSPVHPITVDLVGCGGNGSVMLSCLASIDSALRALGRPGIHVTAHDGDEVSEANLGRQLFASADLYCNKADALVTRFNRIFGTDWKSVPENYSHNPETNIIITCTDNVESRRYVARNFAKEGSADEHRNYYWLDMGNAQTYGQAILGSALIHQPKSARFETVEQLPHVIEMYGISKNEDKASGPSCSLAEALEKQDLFINRMVATAAADILWKLLREGHVENHGYFLNLAEMRMVPVGI